ncbi:MetQ/NlpA family ABC transporter substrate-binding protein [Corynebacterium heidelbergense]|uniref:Methionine ABC transporter substrate-binding protein n=1 Tax=Corynebacterium heidelbergense TaxID=2055947 RepID=A0A364V9X3_9CORY|nr:MetQ/NlpA family ABC transporter substrate-binding protein [Corynebacterium heidelbergense]RAV33460.1 methionine ABC transporter substrate-binding protein [Corynebacterium heidelbergense]WCZ37265.1 D-methionine-binding lipoprotein MetQ precursor [Corynebacterium heidelbergense]
MSLKRKIAAALLATTATMSLASCAGKDKDTIVIGATNTEKPQWDVFKQEAQKVGLKIEVKNFQDYNIPNRALTDGQVDVNNFQHMMFLAQYNVETGSNLVPIGATEIYPLGLYAKDAKSVEEVAKAGEVAIPNDATNQGRAINVLVQAGLVKLKGGQRLTPTPADVDPGASKVKVTPVDAAATATAYLDGKPAIINNDFLINAKIDPKSAIAKDDPKAPQAQPYINGFVTKPEHQNDDKYKKLVEVWHHPEVQKAIDESTGGSAVHVTMDGPQLTDVLHKTEDSFRKENNK